MTGRFLRALTLLAALFLAPPLALAVNPDEILKDPVLETRARAISAQLRCLVCQNQSIDISDAELAKDLRVIVRERLVAGESDAAIIDYVVARYGEFVLLKPRFSPRNLMLWGAPFVLLFSGALVLVLKYRSAGAASPPPGLDENERRQVADMIQGKNTKP